jgi:hypothetical protein
VRKHDRHGDAPLPVNGTEAARDRRIGSQQPQLEQEGATAPAAEHETGGYLGMGGTSSVPFRATGTVQGNKIPLGSFVMAEAADPAYDGCATASPGRALNFPAGYERGIAGAPRQRAALTTRHGMHVHGLPQQRDGDGDDDPEQLRDSDWTDEDDDGCDRVTSIERAARDSAQRKAPAAGIARGSKADCAQYVGVYFAEMTNKAVPFKAQIRFKSKGLCVCYCPTAEVAARAYDAVACMIPHPLGARLCGAHLLLQQSQLRLQRLELALPLPGG